MKVGDTIKTKIDYGHWKKGHQGEIKCHKFEGHHKIYDFGVLLDGNGFYSGFDENEIEILNK